MYIYIYIYLYTHTNTHHPFVMHSNITLYLRPHHQSDLDKNGRGRDHLGLDLLGPGHAATGTSGAL